MLSGIMGSYCHICGNFVDNLDDCELPYGGAPPPLYYYDSPPYEPEENFEVLENPYYTPPLLPDKFEIFLRECPPAKTTRSNTVQLRAQMLSRSISPLLDEIPRLHGIENKLEIVDKIYVFLKDNMDILKKNVKLFDVSKLKLDEFIRDFPVEAGYLKTLRNQMFQQ